MTQLIRMIYDGYRDLMDNKSDPRVNNWAMMSSPFPTLAICLFYGYFVKVLGPKLMENRKPLDLRKVMIWYNLFQVIFSMWLFNEVSIIHIIGFDENSLRYSVFFIFLFVEFVWLGWKLLLQVSTGRLLERSASIADSGRLLVVLHLQVHRIHGHDLLCIKEEE